MIVRSLLAASLTLAFATAFAQDAAPAAAAEPAAPADSAMAPADAAPMAPDKMSGSMMPKGHKHHHTHHHHKGHMADMDHGMRIDHSADHMIVTPTSSKVPAPAAGH